MSSTASWVWLSAVRTTVLVVQLRVAVHFNRNGGNRADVEAGSARPVGNPLKLADD